MGLDTGAVLTQFQGHATGLGIFEQVLLHEPKSAPSNGFTLAIWVDRVRPYPLGSGLASVTMTLVTNFRLYVPFIVQPEDAIDTMLYRLADQLLEGLAGGFELGGSVRNVDLFGESGFPFEGVYGYLTQDGTVFRVLELSVPVIVNDAYTEAP